MYNSGFSYYLKRCCVLVFYCFAEFFLNAALYDSNTKLYGLLWFCSGVVVFPVVDCLPVGCLSVDA